MKFLKIFYVIIVMVVLVPVIKAQKPIVVNSHKFILTGKEYSGVTVSIPQVEFETVKNEWIKLLEKGTKSKVKEAENGEISIFGAYIKSNWGMHLKHIKIINKLGVYEYPEKSNGI